MTEPWYKDAIIYGVDVERFCDGNGDGFGDFVGLASKLPYLADLGITCLWLLPMCPSSDRDNGYDITDQYRIDSRFGTFPDFLAFLAKAGEYSIRVVVDVVLNHTSDQHPWFQASRRDPNSRYRHYYVWAEHPPPVPPGRGTIFPGEETSVWTYDETARSYYYHRFYDFEPGLNPAHPDVRAEMERIIDFWLCFGISGFRVDAASHLIAKNVLPEATPDQPHGILREMFRSATGRVSDVVLLGEVDEPPENIGAFFDGSDQLNMMFNFYVNNYLFLALARGEAEPLVRAFGRLPNAPANFQWANFLRNLDEADWERLAPEELKDVLDAFAPKPEMQIYGRGARRRLAPMLGGDPRRIAMAFSLLFSLPGAPALVYGDEIGMGDDLSRPGRNAVRMPMQWSSGTNAGFSRAPADRLAQPPIADGPLGFKRVNVAEQSADPASLLNRIKRLIHLRRQNGAIGATRWEPRDSGDRRVLVHGYGHGEGALLMVHNLSGSRVELRLPVTQAGVQRLHDLLGGAPVALDGGGTRLVLEPYAYRWYRIEG